MNDAYFGSWGNSGYSLIGRLEKYRQSLIIKHDLRPSEYHTLNDLEVQEPSEFSDVIENYKLKLAKAIIKDIKL